MTRRHSLTEHIAPEFERLAGQYPASAEAFIENARDLHDHNDEFGIMCEALNQFRTSIDAGEAHR